MASEVKKAYGSRERSLLIDRALEFEGGLAEFAFLELTRYRRWLANERRRAKAKKAGSNGQ